MAGKFNPTHMLGTMVQALETSESRDTRALQSHPSRGLKMRNAPAINGGLVLVLTSSYNAIRSESTEAVTSRCFWSWPTSPSRSHQNCWRFMCLSFGKVIDSSEKQYFNLPLSWCHLMKNDCRSHRSVVPIHVSQILHLRHSSSR